MFKIHGFLNTELSYNTVLFESAMLYQEKKNWLKAACLTVYEQICLDLVLFVSSSMPEVVMPQNQMRIKTISMLGKGCIVFGKIELS